MNAARQLNTRDPTRAMHPMEHRWGQRIELEVPVRLELKHRKLGSGLLRNASISGAFIETSAELPLFTNLVVALPAVNRTGEHSAELGACVVRVTPYGFAVEWRDMACPAVEAMLEKASGRPAEVLFHDEFISRA